MTSSLESMTINFNGDRLLPKNETKSRNRKNSSVNSNGDVCQQQTNNATNIKNGVVKKQQSKKERRKNRQVDVDDDDKFEKKKKINAVKQTLNLNNVLAGDRTVKSFLTMENFDKLPLNCRKALLKLLPSCDRVGQSKFKPSTNALNNEYFTQSCIDYKDRLNSGYISPNGKPAEKYTVFSYDKLDPWKRRHFEAYFGEKLKESDSDSLASNKLQPVRRIGVPNGKRKAKSTSRQSTSSESNAFGCRKRRSASLNQRKKKNFPPDNGTSSTVAVEKPVDSSKSKEDEDTTLLSHFSSPSNQIAINQNTAPPLPRLRINLNTKTVRLVPKDDNLDDNLAPPTFNDLEYRSTSSSLSDSQESAIDYCYKNNNYDNNNASTLDYLNSAETPITFYTPAPSSDEPGSSSTLDDSKNYSSYVTPFSSPPDLLDRKPSAAGATKSLEDNLKLFESRCTSKMSDYSVNNYKIGVLRRPRSVPMMKSRLIFGTRYRANSSVHSIEDKNDNYQSKNNSRRKARCSTPCF